MEGGGTLSYTREACPHLGEEFDPGKAQTVVCRLYGISRVLENLKGSVILVHGPKGCANYLQKEALCISRKLAPIVCSDLRDMDLVMGATTALRTALEDVKRVYGPELVVVLTTCSTDIISEDLGPMIRRAQEELGMRILWKKAGGFSAAYDQGYYDGYEILIEGLMEPPRERKKFHVNLIGDLRPLGSDRLELVRMIEGIGLTYNCNLLAGSTIEQVRWSQEAELNMAKCHPTAFRAALLIQTKFGTPYLAPPNPVGVRWTCNWVRQLGAFFAVDEEAERFIAREMKVLEPVISQCRKRVEGKKAIIASGPGKLPGLIALCIELGMEPVLCYAHTYTAEVEKFVMESLEGYREKAKIVWEIGSKHLLEDMVPEIEADVYIGSDVEKSFMYARNTPVVNIMCYSMPYYGFTGAKRLAEHITKIMDNPVRELGKRVLCRKG